MQEQTNIPQIQIESIKSENIVDTLNKLRRGELSLPNSERQIQETANALSNAIIDNIQRDFSSNKMLNFHIFLNF